MSVEGYKPPQHYLLQIHRLKDEPNHHCIVITHEQVFIGMSPDEAIKLGLALMENGSHYKKLNQALIGPILNEERETSIEQTVPATT